jgi:hypothetical protein
MNATAYADQFHAAARDAHTQLSALGPAKVIDLPSDTWLSAQVAAIGAAAAAGQSTVCPHLNASPAVVHTALWAPTQLVCERCLLLLSTDTDVEDSTCDRCRQHVPAVSRATLSLGPLLVHFGLCTPCVNASSVYQAAMPGSGTSSASRAGSADATRRATGRKRPASRNRRR